MPISKNRATGIASKGSRNGKYQPNPASVPPMSGYKAVERLSTLAYNPLLGVLQSLLEIADQSNI